MAGEEKRFFDVSVSNCGELLKIEEDGFIGRLSVESTLVLNVGIGNNATQTIGFFADGKKNIVKAKNRSRFPEYKIFQVRIPIKFSDRLCVSYAEYPQNNIRLIFWYDFGKFDIWEVSIVSQKGIFFAVSQRAYSELSCYFDSAGNVVCPFFEGQPKYWPQLVNFIKENITWPALEEVNSYMEEIVPPVSRDDSKGTVIWYNEAQGLGTALTSLGVARVHWSHICPRPRRAFLQKGEIVSYETISSPQQTKLRPTGLQYELKGVKAL